MLLSCPVPETSKGESVSGTDIFLSYARTDRDIARRFAESFVDEGFTVWWDGALHSGETFDEVIEQNLRNAKAVVVLWSPRSVASRWVRAEATQADRRNKLAPAIIEDCDRPIIFELTHAAELIGWAGETSDVRWRIFMEDLRRVVDRNSDENSASAPRPRSAQSEQKVPNAPEPSARRPLRPGHDEVIFAQQGRGEPPATGPQARSNLRDVNAHAEVHCLELDDEKLGQELFLVDSSGLKIGRSAPADIVLPDKSISREHCMIGLANDELIVTDLNSTNGTYVDEVRISRATILPVGSVVRFGHISLKHSTRSDAETERISGRDRGGGAPGVQPGRSAATV
jgi:hypothetical protein